MGLIMEDWVAGLIHQTSSFYFFFQMMDSAAHIWNNAEGIRKETILLKCTQDNA
jgi:hypothetical protein